MDAVPPPSMLPLSDQGSTAMPSHEYRVVPSPKRGIRARGARRPEDRFARAVEAEMNRMAADGWEFVRSDTLPHEHKPGWFRRPITLFQTVLVFRRAKASDAPHAVPRTAPTAMPPPVVAPHPEAPPVVPPPVPAPAASRFTPSPRAIKPANDLAPVVAAPPAPAPTPAPALTLVEPPEGDDTPPADPDSRRAAE